MRISIDVLTFLLAAIGMTEAQFPFTYTNCHLEFTIEDAPQRAVSLNQGTTEMLLGLGLEDNMAGTAYLDDAIWPEFAEAYDKVPVLEESAYPNITTLMGANPDFIYASYRSAFQAKTTPTQRRIDYFSVLEEGCELVLETSRGNYTYCREELDQVLNIPNYLQTPSCEFNEYRPDELTIEHLYSEINDVASIFGVKENANSLIATIQDHFNSAKALHSGEEEPLSVLFLDSWGDETPYVGACCGSINSIIEYAGAVNVFADLGLEERRTWARANWTTIAEKDPDVIIVVDASWDRANEKLYNLCDNEMTRNLRAVQNRRFIIVPFSATTMGVRIGSLAYNLAEAITALANNGPLSSVQFTEISLVEDNSREALGKSGAIIYTRLPIFNGVDLESFCPGGQSSIFITDDSGHSDSDDHDGHDHGGAGFEWSGVFPLSDDEHVWSMQAVDGEYADPSMRLVLFAVDSATEVAMEAKEDMANSMIKGDSCQKVMEGGRMGPISSGGVCYELHVGTSDDSLFPMATGGVSNLAIFAQHFPTEFERDQHYLKDSNGVDIEPAVQVGGDGHDHAHDHGGHGSEHPCACEAEELNFKIDCDDTATMIQSLQLLNLGGCVNDCSSNACKANYFIVQAHHDYCPEAGLPEQVEDGFHDYDSICEHCAISRKAVEGAPDCPPANCDDNSGNEAYVSAINKGCLSDCSSQECEDLFTTLRVVHDSCPHDVLSPASERGLHDLEVPCAQVACNEVGAPDPLVCEEDDDSEDDGEGGSIGICFSATDVVSVENRGLVKMSDLAIGDMVMVSDNEFEPIYSFGHKDDTASAKYLRITTNGISEPLEISPAHMIIVEGNRFVPASMLKKGDMLQTGNGAFVAVKNVKIVTRKGAYAPFTKSGKIIVNNIVASNYIAYQGSEYLRIGNMETSLSYHWIAHTFKSVHRLAIMMGLEGENYTETGISHWVNIPHKAFQWVLELNPFVACTLIFLSLVFFGLASILELLLANQLLVVSITVGVGSVVFFNTSKKTTALLHR